MRSLGSKKVWFHEANRCRAPETLLLPRTHAPEKRVTTVLINIPNLVDSIILASFRNKIKGVSVDGPKPGDFEIVFSEHLWQVAGCNLDSSIVESLADLNDVTFIWKRTGMPGSLHPSISDANDFNSRKRVQVRVP